MSVSNFSQGLEGNSGCNIGVFGLEAWYLLHIAAPRFFMSSVIPGQDTASFANKMHFVSL